MHSCCRCVWPVSQDEREQPTARKATKAAGTLTIRAQFRLLQRCTDILSSVLSITFVLLLSVSACVYTVESFIFLVLFCTSVSFSSQLTEQQCQCLECCTRTVCWTLPPLVSCHLTSSPAIHRCNATLIERCKWHTASYTAVYECVLYKCTRTLCAVSFSNDSFVVARWALRKPLSYALTSSWTELNWIEQQVACGMLFVPSGWTGRTHTHTHTRNESPAQLLRARLPLYFLRTSRSNPLRWVELRLDDLNSATKHTLWLWVCRGEKFRVQRVKRLVPGEGVQRRLLLRTNSLVTSQTNTALQCQISANSNGEFEK